MTVMVSTKERGVEFSYQEYRQILQKVGPGLIDYPQAQEAETFTLLRHDVEFSVPRAFEMARIEQAMGICSTFFFQVISSGYNPLSVVNRTRIRAMKEMGHHIGLHLYISHVPEGDWDSLQDELARQRLILETGLDLECTRFSFHRPPRWTLENRSDEIGGLLNAYGASFFEFTETPSQIRYLADSKHQWSYGHPLEDILQQKVQILIHPEEWSEQGGDIKETFRGLIDDHRNDFIETVDQETQRFKQYRADLQ